MLKCCKNLTNTNKWQTKFYSERDFMKNQRLTFKFTLMFALFTILTLLITAQLSYYNQVNLYQHQREVSIQYIADYLDKLVVSDSDNFLNMQHYFIAHYNEFKIPVDYGEEEIEQSRMRYETLKEAQFPGKVIGKDIRFDELSNEVKAAHALYNYEYYRYMFEEAAKSFNIIYAYYLVPTGESEHVYWFLDAVRDPEEEGSPNLYLCMDIEDDREHHPRMWEAWDTEKRPEGYDTYDNEYGRTYAYYTPLFIEGEKLGIIGVEVEIAKVNHEILRATIRQILMVGSVLVILVILLLSIIRTQYIRKLIKLQAVIEDYSQNKNPDIAENLTSEVTNEDEISVIMAKFADMIYELELYIQNLTKTKKDLQDTRQQAIELNELAMKDSLTGIRNKTGYDKEVQKLEWELADDLTEFGVAMIDLNFLKRINDTYGHDKGNVAIITLCRIVCHIFEHSPVFRIGGDEFVVILKGHDLEHVDELIAEFNRQLKERQENTELEYWEQTSAAIGYAVYDKKIDSAYDNVFKRADAEMYKAKKAMKAVRED